MLEEKTFEFTQEEQCQAAHGNLVALILVATLYLQEHALDVPTFWEFIGQHFSRGWADVPLGDIQEASRRIIWNLVSCGGQLESLKLDKDQAELVIQGWPPEDSAQFFAVSAEDAAQMVEVFRPITASLAIAYDWQLDDGAIKIHLQKE
jgi:hypothetical protein